MAKNKYSKKEIQDLAASYALGVLAKKDFSTVKSILSKGNITAENELRGFTQVVNQLGCNSSLRKPPKNLKERLFEAVRSRRKSTQEIAPGRGFLYVRSFEGNWEEVVKGVRVKNLYADRRNKYSTVLVQMSPGASFPSHKHAETEECYIISGDLHMGGKVFHAGDYIRADADSIHEGIYSETGCTLLVAASQENEMLV